MGRRPGPERKSAAKALANAVNGGKLKLASRKGTPATEIVLRDNLERLRTECVPAWVQLTIDIVNDNVKDHRGRRVHLSLEFRHKVGSDAADRGGLPRTPIAAVALAADPPKLFILGDDDDTEFPPPPGWNGTPPDDAPVDRPTIPAVIPETNGAAERATVPDNPTLISTTSADEALE